MRCGSPEHLPVPVKHKLNVYCCALHMSCIVIHTSVHNGIVKYVLIWAKERQGGMKWWGRSVGVGSLVQIPTINHIWLAIASPSHTITKTCLGCSTSFLFSDHILVWIGGGGGDSNVFPLQFVYLQLANCTYTCMGKGYSQTCITDLYNKQNARTHAHTHTRAHTHIHTHTILYISSVVIRTVVSPDFRSNFWFGDFQLFR